MWLLKQLSDELGFLKGGTKGRLVHETDCSFPEQKQVPEGKTVPYGWRLTGNLQTATTTSPATVA